MIDIHARMAQLAKTRPIFPFDAVLAPLIDFFARYGLGLGLLIFGFICTYRLTDYAMGMMANP